MNRSCLVTGATGAVGPSVVAALCDAGFRVTAFGRNRPEVGVLPAGVEFVEGDVTDREQVASAVGNKQVVVHLASLLHINDPSPAQRLEFERVNVGGTRHVVEAAAAECERVVVVSTIAAYGYAASGALREESPTAPTTAYGETKLAAERVALAATRPDGSPLSTVLRLAAVYGPRVKGNYRTLLGALARGRFVPIGPGGNRRTLVHTSDVARAVCLAVDHPVAAGAIYNVTDGESPTLSTIIDEMCGALDRTAPRVHVPVRLARAAGAGIDLLTGLVGRPRRVRTLISKYLEEVIVDGGKIQAELGFEPQFDMRSGWRETVRELRAAGDL